MLLVYNAALTRDDHRLKGKGGEYVQNAPRMARRLLMTGSTAPEGDFKVCET
jgi:hypothetical protein